MATNDNYDPEKDKALHEDAETLGVAAGTGLGCLGLAFLPWSIMIIVFAIFVVVWYFIRHTHGAG